MAPAIQVAGVSKRFRLYHEKYQSLKERVIHFSRTPSEDFWALCDIDLEVQQGETFGLVGHNGSGKSTLLKLIAGILKPTTGHIRTVGRLAALLELGAGFHPDLTGRENVFLNGSIYGIGKREIEAKFDDIVAFAELEQFIDNQVKHYSAGMYVRLGFAVAVHLDPEVLLIDEVLAVGDEAFQAKCLGRVRQFQAEGRTILLVTHNADIVPQVCDRAAVLDHGDMVMVGPPGEAVRVFREYLYGPAVEPEAPPPAAEEPQPVQITDVALDCPEADGRPCLVPGGPLTIRVSYSAGRIEAPRFSLSIHDVQGAQLFGTDNEILGVPIDVLDGEGTVVFSIDEVPLLDGTYDVEVKVMSRDGVVYDRRGGRDHFEVMSPGRTSGRIELPVRVRVERAPVTEEAAP